MRVLIAVAVLMMCGCAKHLQYLQEYATPDDIGTHPQELAEALSWCHAHDWRTDQWATIVDGRIIPCNTAGHMVADLSYRELAGQLKRIQDTQAYEPAKQEKAQSASGANTCLGDKDCKFTQPLPFDLPAKEWDGPDTRGEGLVKEFPLSDVCKKDPIWCAVKVHHISCKDVAPDWRQRTDPIRTGDGKYHCFAFYLLEPKP